MTERIIIHELEPESYQAMMGLEKYLNQTGLNKILKELIKIRATLRDFFCSLPFSTKRLSLRDKINFICYSLLFPYDFQLLTL
jgi:hypothetical protein